MASTKVYALLVGINDYRTDVPIIPNCQYHPLNGCIPDVEKVRKYLEKDPSVEADILVLTDTDATKEAVAKAWIQHLAKARVGETIFFYFSGHGVAEAADSTLWPTETDGRLETIVCYNNGSPCLLADKELRYLIHQAGHYLPNGGKKEGLPHILTLFDNCHSGDNTRNGYVQEQLSDVRERRLPCVAPQRHWEHFLFANQFSEEALKEKGVDTLIPQTPHVHLAACEPHESAYESDRQGVFTRYLLDHLQREGGAVSYTQLISRIRHGLRNGRFDQKPKLFLPPGQATDAQTYFLGKPAEKNIRYCELLFNPREGWILNAGILNGIESDTTHLRIEVKGYGQWPVEIRQVHLDYSEVKLEGDLQLSKQEAHPVLVEGLHSQPLRLFVENIDLSRSEFEVFYRHTLANCPFLDFVDELEEADYALHFRFNQMYLSLPSYRFRPLLLPQPIEDPEQMAKRLAPLLKQVAEVVYLQKIEKTSALLDALDISVEGEDEQGRFHPLPIRGGQLSVQFHASSPGTWTGALRIRIHNRSDRRLYVAALYLTQNFMVYSQFLSPSVYILEPDNEVLLWQHQQQERLQGRIPLHLEDYINDYNWPESSDELRFLVSTDEFTVENLDREALHGPLTADDVLKGKTRGGLDVGAPTPNLSRSDWAVLPLQLVFKNPSYNRITDRTLQTLLQDERTAGFITEIYFNQLNNNELSRTFKEEIELEEEGLVAAKGVFFDTVVDIANFGARKLRRWRFQSQMRRFPNRVLMVSEGDSWFQHPLLKDLIDHLSNFYNIYSTGAAGDEMRNYLMSGEFKEAVDIVEKEYNRPIQFFLLSGGGNDILGSQFKHYLNAYAEVEDLPEGEAINRFFNDRYQSEMDSLMEFYDILIGHWFTHKPKMQLITHGYDYVIPHAPDSKERSWLGAPMTEKGIVRSGDRKGLIAHMINEFNDRLLAITEKYPNAYHVDARGRVGAHQWADEIHPDNEGYQNVAMQFVKIIDGIIRSVES